jgi:glycogen synthase
MNIAFLCNEIPPAPAGGIGTFTWELVRALNTKDHWVEVVCLDKHVRSNTCEMISPRLRIHRIPYGPGRVGGYVTRIRLYRFIRKLAVKRRIDIVEVPDFEGWCAGWPQLPIPVVVRLHGSASYFAEEMHVPLSRSLGLLERLAVLRADRVVAVSRYTAHQSEKVFGFPLPSTVIYNSVVLPDANRIKTDFVSRDLVCYSGTLVEKKGVFSLARAWQLVKQRRPRARLLMIGRDGGHRGRSSIEVIRELAGIYADSIDCIGHVPKPNVEARLIAADVAVYPSYSETFALAPMEAMGLSVPTIYTTRASGPELVRHNVDAWLCDPDNIDELADQLVILLENEPLRRRLGAAGRRRVSEGYSYAAALEHNICFYQRCIAGQETSRDQAADRPSL